VRVTWSVNVYESAILPLTSAAQIPLVLRSFPSPRTFYGSVYLDFIAAAYSDADAEYQSHRVAPTIRVFFFSTIYPCLCYFINACVPELYFVVCTCVLKDAKHLCLQREVLARDSPEQQSKTPRTRCCADPLAARSSLHCSRCPCCRMTATEELQKIVLSPGSAQARLSSLKKHNRKGTSAFPPPQKIPRRRRQLPNKGASVRRAL